MLDANGNPIQPGFTTNVAAGQGIVPIQPGFVPNNQPINPSGCAVVLPFQAVQARPYQSPATMAIDGSKLLAFGSNFWTDTITNRDLTTKQIIFSPLVGIAGAAPYFAFPADAAVDSPLVDDNFGVGNAKKLEGGNRRSMAVAMLAQQIQVTASSSAQIQQNITTGYIDANLNTCQNQQLTNICSPCNNFNNNPNIFQQVFTFPWIWGDASFVKYPLLPGAGLPVVGNSITISVIGSGSETKSFGNNC